jgi:hypothetical protein
MSKPTLIFLPGAWHSPEIFNAVILKLSAHGYKSTALPLQAVIQKPAVKDLQPDIDALRSAVLKEADAGNDVMVVGHSWSSIIVCGALEGLSKEERKKGGKEGGVVKQAFLTGFIPPENVSLITAFGGTAPEWYNVDVSPTLTFMMKAILMCINRSHGSHAKIPYQPSITTLIPTKLRIVGGGGESLS